MHELDVLPWAQIHQFLSLQTLEYVFEYVLNLLEIQEIFLVLSTCVLLLFLWDSDFGRIQ